MAEDGLPFGRGALYHLLQNKLYLGMIVHKEQAHAGQHPAIVPQALWDQAQEALGTNRVQRRKAKAAGTSDLLTGLLHDAAGNAMVPTHVRKANGQRYRYYVSQPLTAGARKSSDGLMRISAPAIEEVVEREVRVRLRPEEGKRWKSAGPVEQSRRLRSWLADVVVRPQEVEIGFTPAGVASLMRGNAAADRVSVPIRLKSNAQGTVILTPDSEARHAPTIDKALVRAVARSNHWRQMLETGKVRTSYDLARHEGCRVSYVQRHLALAFLPPILVEQILDGTQPVGCSLSELIDRPVPLSWAGIII